MTHHLWRRFVLFSFSFIIWNTQKDEGFTKRDHLLSFTKVTEYSAYGAIMPRSFYIFQRIWDFPMSLQEHSWCLPVMLLSVMIVVLSDTLGIKKTLLVGAVTLLFHGF